MEAVAFKLWSHVSKREPLRPLSLIFYGPTGVGKSELGKAVAPALNRCLGEERYRPVWTELNTFTQAHSVHRLTARRRATWAMRISPSSRRCAGIPAPSSCSTSWKRPIRKS